MNYTELAHEMARALGRIEGKLDTLCEDVKDIQSRQDIIERRLDLVKGGLAALAAFFTIISLPKVAAFFASFSA